MECIPIGEKIVTVSVQTHGTIIDVNLPPELHSLFNKTRLFSFAGAYQSAFYSHADAKRFMKKMVQTFARDIEGKSMVEQLDEYILPLEEEYVRSLSTSSNVIEQNVCKKIGAITIDKAFAKEEETFFQKCVHKFLLPDLENIYIVSVHEKVGRNKYKLLSNPKKSLLDLSFIEQQGRPDIVDWIRDEATPFPDITGATNRIETLETENKEENKDKIAEIKRKIYQQLQSWKCTVKDKDITSIRLSFLTQILQMLYGADCRIQYMDYSCNELSIFVPEEQYSYKLYHGVADIEQGIAGGRNDLMCGRNKIKKKKTKKKRKSRYSTQKRN